MRVPPSSVLTMVPHERDYRGMRNRSDTMHRGIPVQEFLPPSRIPNQQLTLDKVEPSHFVDIQQTVQLRRIRRAIREKANPHRGVHQNHHAVLGVRASPRRLGTSTAVFSLPLNRRSL